MKLAYFSSFPDYSADNFSMNEYINTYVTSNVIIDAASSDTYYAPHKSTLTIKSVFSGEEYYSTKECKYKVKPDNYLILNAGQEYESRIESESKVHSFSVFFNPEFVKEAYSSLTISEEKLVTSEKGNTCSGAHCKAKPTALQVACAACRPCLPVPQLALPALMINARISASAFKCWRHNCTGAAANAF